MKISRIIFLVAIVVSIVLIGNATAAQATPALIGNLAQVTGQGNSSASTGVAPDQSVKPPHVDGGSGDSLSGSFVTFDPSGGGDTCYIPGNTQTFCFRAETYTNDWGYVYNLWQRFPSDWTVTNVYVQGTPSCTGGGTWGTLSWSFLTAPYEVNIAHSRYQASTDHCVATYCFDVVAGSGTPNALESWYWAGDSYGNPPYHPCSNDSYTPGGQAACDEAAQPQASVPPCAIDPGVYLLPPTLETSGCNGEAQTHTFSLFNNTGSDGAFDLAYAVPSSNGTLTGPATLPVANGATVPFDVELTPALCALPGDTVAATIDASGNSYTDQSVITKTVDTAPQWVATPASAPAWAGSGYPSDGCTALNGAGEWVTYEIGDLTGAGITGFWGYNHTTNAWSQPGPTGTPADRWAPDWAYDPEANLCYMTGGANTPGVGTYNEAYVFDPVANAFTALPSFTTIRDFHDSWVGFVDGVKYLCIGGGNNGAGLTSTQCFDLVAGTWSAENATLGAYPTDIWGAADGTLPAAASPSGGNQFWTVSGVQAGGLVDAAFYWDDADNAWHAAGNTGVTRYRLEGDFFNGDFYQLGGSSGGYTPTSDVVRGQFDGANWVWRTGPNLNNARMDNVVAATNDNIWSVDGYGSNAPAFVEYAVPCPECTELGHLDGFVLDGDHPLAGGAAGGIDSLSGSNVTFDPTAGGSTCFDPGVPQTFCYEAESFTADYEYRYSVWLKFPADWTVSNAYVVGTPTCDSGAAWGAFSWSFETSPYEIEINHTAYQSTTDHCVATYCVDAVPGTGSTDALTSWYWDGDGYNAPPHHPCSSDGYTPASMAAEPCDEAVNPPAFVPPCNVGPLAPPCTPATVTINPGNLTVLVDPLTGHYGPVALLPGAYQVEASAPGYSTAFADVVIVDEITTTQDLILNRPAIAVDPAALTVAARAETPTTVPLTITNQGSLPLNWEIVELPAGVKVSTAPKVPAGTYVQTPAATGVDPFILDQIAQSPDGNVDFFIAFKNTADLSGAYNLTAKADKVAYVREALRQAADQAQVNVRAWLDLRGIQYKVYYIDNTISVHAGQSVIDALAAFPEISGFHGNHMYTTMPLEKLPAFSLQKVTVELPGNEPNAILPWDLNIMNIPQVWTNLGVTGAGVIVANVDTGVYYQHEALFPNYLCGAGPHTDCWLDPDAGTTQPTDTNGHGTATMSQMAADNNPAFAYAVGGAPDAGWIACRGCPPSGCSDNSLNTCADWLVMTTPNTPDIVNNSWGTWSALCDNWYDGKIAAYRAAGIVPVWAAGNIGNACNTSTPPANSIGTFAVGATTSADVQASFSSTGPGLCSGRTQFPDISAPGDSTCGATTSGGYNCGFGGTSFAAPRAAGCAALMKSANPSLTIDQIMNVMMATAVDKPNSDCGAPQPDPNYRYGDGRVDCLAAVSAVYSGDIPWVWESPISGTLGARGSEIVDVTFECSAAQVGQTLTGTLRINHNDPCTDPVDVPLTFTCLGTPVIEVTPPSLSALQPPDIVTTQTLNIGNVGNGPLDWSIFEWMAAQKISFGPATDNQPQTNADVAPSSRAPIGTLALGDALFTAPAQATTADNQMLGVAFDGTYYWMTGGNTGLDPNKLYQVDTAGVLINTYDQPAGCITWGGRDLAYDGAYLYFGCDDGLVHQIDPATGAEVGTIPAPLAPARALAYDPTTDHFWTANFDSNIYEFDRAGVIINTFAPVGLSTYGMAWDTVSPGGPFLWLWSQDGTPSVMASQVNPVTGLLTGVAFQGIDLSGAGTDLAGGIEITTDLVPGMAVFVAMHQSTVDTVVVYELGPSGPVPCDSPADIPWLSEAPVNGTVIPGATMPVVVSFDSTGLATGTYTGTLCVQSNDPVNPLVPVPVELTVADIPAIDVTPPALAATQPPDVVTDQTLNIGNVGSADLVWDIFEWMAAQKISFGPAIANQPQTNADVAPSSHKPIGTFAFGDALFQVPMETIIGNNLLLGIEFDGAYYWVTGADPSFTVPGYLYQVDTAGVLINTFSQPAACTGWGGRDLAYDGAYLYFGCDDGLVHQIDPATGAEVGTIPAPIIPARALAYDPATDHFWTASWDSNIFEFDRAGVIINTFAPVGLSTYGMAWDTVSPGGPFLWLWSQDGVSVLAMASQLNPTTGALTGVVFEGISTSGGDMAGGIAITTDLVPGMAVFVAMHQAAPDTVVVYELGSTVCNSPVDIPWLSEAPLGGTVLPGETQPVVVSFDSTGLAVGTYNGTLCVASNDPVNPLVQVPVSLTVVPPYPVITFIYNDAEDVVAIGEDVTIRGDFNGWSDTPMTPNADYSVFTATLPIAPGSYQYKYYMPDLPDWSNWDMLNTSNRLLDVTGDATLNEYRNVSVGWSHLGDPVAVTITHGADSGPLNGEVYIQNVTSPAGEGRGVAAQLGYGTNPDPATWTWVNMAYTGDSGFNDLFAAVITQPAVGAYIFGVRFDGNRGAGNPHAGWTNGDRTGTLVVLPVADLQVTKVAPAEVFTGDTFTYTITVANNGPDNATGVTVVDTLPAGVTFVSASVGCENVDGVVTCDVGALAAGNSATITIVVVAPDTEGDLVNTVVVTGNEFDPVADNNTATTTTTVTEEIMKVYLPLIYKAP